MTARDFDEKPPMERPAPGLSTTALKPPRCAGNEPFGSSGSRRAEARGQVFDPFHQSYSDRHGSIHEVAA
ncbi:MAG: hypothetical protein HQL56_00765 [Magnetococcales bacterium]|nr:hypothetical protein [Magnetococcales bacterium]